MWLWWILSLITLIVTLLFAAKVFASTRDLQRRVRSHKSELSQDIKDFPIEKPIKVLRQQHEISDLRRKMKLLEEYNINNSLQIHTLAERFDKVQGSIIKTTPSNLEDGVNWQELYYDLLDKNEKLESEVDLTQIKLSELESILKDVPPKKDTGALQSDIDIEHMLNESLQETVDDLRKKLAASLTRENELRIELNEEENNKVQLFKIKQQYLKLQNEIVEINKLGLKDNDVEIVLEQKLKAINGQEWKPEKFTPENTNLQLSLQDIIVENTALTNRIADLCEKLSQGKQ